MEAEVAHCLSLERGSKERRKQWGILVNKGDFEYNMTCFDTGEAPIPKYRSKSVNIHDLLPCSKCKGMYQKKQLSAHSKHCFATGKDIKERGLSESRCMLPMPRGTKLSFWQQVLGKMHDDDISKCVKSDPLIVDYGTRKYSRRDVEEHTSGNVSGRMRELERLLLLMRQSSKVENLSDIIAPEHCEELVEAVKKLTGYDEATHTFQKAQLARNLGYSLRKCAEIKKVTVGMTDDQECQNATKFLAWFDASWCDFISSVAKQSMDKKRFNKEVLQPSCQDVSNLYNYVKQEGKSAKSCDDYQTLVKATMCEMLLFNRKRAGEVQRLKKKEYEKMKQTKEIDPNIEKTLSKFEQHLVRSQARIEVRGKFGRKTALLLTKSMVENIDHILFLQSKKDGKAFESPYVFATLSGNRPYRTCDVIRYFCSEANVKNPAIFRSTNLRKHIATMTQCMELTERDQDLLAEFMGHDIRIHRKYYRLPMDILQKSKVAKFLLEANGQLQSDLSKESTDGEDECEEDCEDTPQRNQDARRPLNKRKSTEGEEDCEDNPQRNQNARPLNKRKSTEGEEDCGDNMQGNEMKRRKVSIKRKWTDLEIAAVTRNFKDSFRRLKVPGKQEIEEVKVREPALKDRTWRNIKDYVSNRIRTMKF